VTAFETVALDLPGGAFQALAAGSGRPVRYLHGFPDHPPTARGFLGELARSLPTPIRYDRAMVRPLRTFAARRRALEVTIPTPLLQLHGQQDGCIAPAPDDLDRRWFAARDHRVVPKAGHFLFQEAPRKAARVAACLA